MFRLDPRESRWKNPRGRFFLFIHPDKGTGAVLLMLHASRARVAFSCTGQRENVAVAGIKEYGRLVPRRTHILVSGRFRGIVVLLRTGSRRPARRAGPRFFVLRPRLSRERRTFLNSKWTFLPGECCQVGAR